MSYASEQATVGRRPLVVLELDLDTCAETYGNALTSPATGNCTASGASGSECYNTRATCQDPANYNQSTKTYRFCEPLAGLPVGVEMIPSIDSVGIVPTRILSDSRFSFGYRASVTVTLIDHTHHDRGFDPYVANRSYDPDAQGTFWGRLRARTPYYQGRTMRLRVGYLADTWDWANFEDREYVIEEIRGPDSNGRVQVIGKDVLKLTDKDRIKVPAASEGELAFDIDSTQITLSVIGGTYTDPAASPQTNQWVRIGDEIIKYTGISGAGTSGDPWVLSGLSRGDRTSTTWGSLAESHSAGDQVQLCKAWEAVNVRDVIDELLTTYAGISSSYITAADWDSESARWLSQATVTTILSEPVGVDDLISELQNQCMLRIWWDEIAQKIRFKVIAPPIGTTPETLTDASNLLAESLSIKDNPKERVTQVWIYYDPKDYTKDEVGNYQRVYIAADLNAEAADQYGEQRIRVIESRWFNENNKAFVSQTASRYLSNFRDNPRDLKFSLDAKDSSNKTGDIVDVSSGDIQDVDGSALTTRIMIAEVKESRPGHQYDYMGFTGISTSRFGAIGWPDTQSPIMPDYTAASAATQLAYAFICDTSTLQMSDGDDPYRII